MPTDFEAVSNGEIIEASHITQYAVPVQDIENASPFFAVASGGTDSYAVTMAPVPPDPLPTGFMVHFQAETANDGPATLSVNGQGPFPLCKRGDDTLLSGAIAAGQIVAAVFDGAAFQVVGVNPPEALDELTDVVLTSPANRDFLAYDGTDWENRALEAADMPSGIDAAKLADGSVSNAEFQRLDGVTSGIQSQLDGKASTSHTHGLDDLTDVAVGSPADRQVLIYDGTTDNRWENRALQAADMPSGIDAAKLADGSVSNTEFQYLNGLTGNIQDQLDNLTPSTALDALTDVAVSSPADRQVLIYDGTTDNRWENRALQAADMPSGVDAAKLADGSVSNTEFQYLNGLTGNIQDQMDNLIPDGMVLDDLTDVAVSSPADRQVLIYDGMTERWENRALQAADMPSGIDAAKLADGSVSNAEFQRLDGVSSNIQSQLDGKASTSHTHAATDIVSGTLDAARLPTVPVNKLDGLTGGMTAGRYLRAADSDTLEERTTSQVLSDIGAAAASHTHSAADINSGTLDAARLPTVPVNKLDGLTGGMTAGRYLRAADSDTLEERTSSQVLSDIGAAAASHTHSAADINSGTLDAARLPTVPVNKLDGLTGGMTAGRYLRAADSDSLEERTTSQVLSDIGAAASSHTHSAADITSGTLATARLGSGTADSGKFLRGDQTWSTPGVAAPSIVVKTSTDSAWTIPTDATILRISAWGGGGGGGAGSSGSFGHVSPGPRGGAGGGGASMIQGVFSAAALRALSSTLNIQIGSGGAGGASVSGNNNGNAGSNGGNTTVTASSQQILFAPGGRAGAGGNWTDGGGPSSGGASLPPRSGTSQGNGTPDPIAAGLHIGGFGGGSGTGFDVSGYGSYLGAGGGGAGASSASATGKVGGVGGYGLDSGQTPPAQSTAASAHSVTTIPGCGGGGGAAATTGGPGAKGGGGGGGGYAFSSASGAGGAGGTGFVVIELW